MCSLPVYSQDRQSQGSHITMQAQYLLTSSGPELRITFFSFVDSDYFSLLSTDSSSRWKQPRERISPASCGNT